MLTTEIKVSVIIANWNGDTILEQCIASIYAHTVSTPFEIIVVDDASTDESPVRAKERFPEIRLIRNPTNMGYARTNNNALTHSRGEYLLLLNNDAEFKNDVLGHFVRYMDAHPEVGICGGTLFNPDGTRQHSYGHFPSLKMEVTALFSLHRLTKQPLPELGIVPTEKTGIGEVDMIVGAGLFIRAALAFELGLYDASFEAYFEDSDLCYRAIQRGYKVVFLPEAHLLHLYSYSYGAIGSNEQSLKRIYSKKRRIAEGYKRFCRKHYDWYKVILFAHSLVLLRYSMSNGILSLFIPSRRSVFYDYLTSLGAFVRWDDV